MAFEPRVYIVKKGDSLYKIASQFNTTVESIMSLNNLTSTNLDIGQKLIIPAYTEVVVNLNGTPVYKERKTSSTVMAKFSEGARVRVTGYSDGWYKVKIFNGNSGWMSKSAVTMKVYDGTKPIASIVGFYVLEEGPGLPSSFTSFNTNKNLMSEVALFMYRFSQTNIGEVEKFGNFTDNDVKTLVAIAHRNNVRILPVIHNLLYKPGGVNASKDVVRSVVSSPENRNKFVQSVLNLVKTFNFDGANLDIEDVYFEDSKNISLLYAELGAALRRQGYILTSSVPSRASDAMLNPFSNAFDYAAIGKAVDKFGVMLYNEHGWPGSGPGPVVSIGWMERVLKYTITKMPSNKVFSDVSVFGFDFNLATGDAKYVTYDIAIGIAQKYGSQIIFDEKTQTPMFSYTAENGNKHEVWFEDSRSIKSKIDLAYSLKTDGVAFWRLGLEDKNIWKMINDEVVVKR